MNFGLKSQDLGEIIKIIQQVKAVDVAIIFGSRAKGHYKKGSDVDIAIKGKEITRENIASLSDLLNEESALPYYFDIVHYDEIAEQELIQHIDRVGQSIYLRDVGGVKP